MKVRRVLGSRRPPNPQTASTPSSLFGDIETDQCILYEQLNSLNMQSEKFNEIISYKIRISIISFSIYFVTILLSTIAITEMMIASPIFVTTGDGALFQVGVRCGIIEEANLGTFCVLFTGLNSAMMYQNLQI